MLRAELFKAMSRVALIAVGVLACGYLLLGMQLLVTGFKDPVLHLTLTTIFVLILSPIAAFPLVIMSDRLRKVKVELEAMLRIDGLTDLPNRRAFFEKAAEVFARDGPISLMMIDIDHFKQVNDSYGHDIGDRVLRSVAQSLQQVVANAPGTGVKFAARIGGEEFAVLVEGLDPKLAGQLAHDLVLKVQQLPVRGSVQLISVTLSAGVAHRRAGDSPDVVLRAADNACYRAKRLGRNQWRDADIVDDKPGSQKASVKASMTAA